MAAKATFDTVNKLILLDIVAPVSARVAIDAQVDLYSDGKEEWQAEAFQKFEFPFTTIGGNELGGGLEAGDYYFLRTDLGWRIRPFEESHTLTLTGNIYPIDANDDLIVQTSTSVTVATILERSQLTQTVQDQVAAMASAVWQVPTSTGVADTFGGAVKQLTFGSKIFFDGDLGTAGENYPHGTQKYPVNNFADALAISVRESVPIVHMESEGTILATDDVTGCIIEGHHPLKVQCQVSAGAVTTNAQFREVYLRNADLNGSVVCRESLLDNITGFQGFAFQCMLNPGTIQLTGASPTHFLDCFSGQPGTSTPIIDINGKNADIGIRNYNGGIELQNNTANNNISIDLNSGQIILASTCTAGTIVCRGVGKLTDNSNGATVVDEMVGSSGALSNAQDTRLKELHQIFGLESGSPLLTTASSRVAASVTQAITGDPETAITITRA